MQITGNTQPPATSQPNETRTGASSQSTDPSSGFFLNVATQKFSSARNNPDGRQSSSSSSSSRPSTPDSDHGDWTEVNGDVIANSGDVYIAKNIGKIESVKNYGAGNTDNLNNLEEIIKKSVNCKGDLVANTGDVIKSKIIGDITSTRHYHSDDINLDERFERLNKIFENADGIQGDIIANNGDYIKADTIGPLNLTSTFFSSGSTFTSRHDKNKIKTPGNPANKDSARSAGANSSQGSSNNAGVRPGPSTGTTNVFGGESSFIRTEKVTGTISSCENINGLKSHDVHRVPRTGIIMSSKGTVETYNHGKPV